MSTPLDPRLLADIRAAEDTRFEAYRDSKGFWTVGVGHKLPVGRDYSRYTATTAQVATWLMDDLQDALAASQRLPEWRSLDTSTRQNAVTELVFNMGPTKWAGFHKCRAAISDQVWPTAAAELLNSEWAKQVHETRANRLSGYLEKGQYPL